MKRIASVLLSALMLLSVVAVAANAAPTSWGTINAIKGTAVIDGVIDEAWNKAEIHYLDKVGGSNDTTPDPIARFRTMWDENYVYFLFEVYDETTIGGITEEGWAYEEKSAGGNLWKRDGVSFAFDPANDQSATAFAAPSFWFILATQGHTANWNTVPEATFITEDSGATKMFAFKFIQDAAGKTIGYILENKVNLKARYSEFKNEANTEFGFSACLNDNDYTKAAAAREELRLLTDGNVNKNNAQKMTVVLNAEGTSYTNSAKDLRFPTPEGVILPEDTTAEQTTVEEPTTEEPTTEAPATEEPATEEPVPPLGDGFGIYAVIAAAAVLGSAIIIRKKVRD